SGHLKPIKERAFQGIVEGDVPLTPIQQFFFSRDLTRMNHYNQSFMIHRPEGFDEEILEKVFTKLIRHHDALRMVFVPEDGKTRQINRGIEPNPVNIDVHRITAEPYEKIIEEKCNQIQAYIDLRQGPLFKTGLFKTKNGDYLLIAIHHLVIDGVSWRILSEDIATFYQQYQKGVPEEKFDISLKTTPYKEWAEKLVEYADQEPLLGEIEYWKNLDETETSSLLLNEPGPVRKRGDCKEISFELDREDTGKLLTETDKAYNTRINDTLLAALAMALNHWTGAQKVPIALEGHGREEIIPHVDINRTVGWFTTLFPVVLDIKNSTDIAAVIIDTKENLRRIPNKGIGYGILKYLTKEEHKQGMQFRLNPPVAFNYLGQFDQEIDSEFFRLATISSGHSVSLESQEMHPLSFTGSVSARRLKMVLRYDPREYEEEKVRTLMDEYKENLGKVIRHCLEKEETEMTLSDYSTEIEAEEADAVFEILGEFSID
ncbi:MAG: hypothetical protein GY940_24380, partial [bacterium]|nr:hypothetical protein [bacterium]